MIVKTVNIEAKTAHRRIVVAFLIAATCLLAMAASVRAQEIPEEAYISGVIGHAQSYKLSCESRSAADWAAYWGFDVSEYEILAALPRTDNPETGFVGNPSGAWGSIPPWSYGVHPPPLAAVLRDFGIPAQETQGLGWDGLRQEIAAGRPVIVWVIGQMWNGTPISYTASDGQTTTVAYYEHSMIVNGYGPGLVYVIDAYTGYDQVYDLNTFLASWAVLGQRAIVAGQNMPVRPTPAPLSAGGTYEVQRGDTLISLAEQFDLYWRDLAALNEIGYPYLLYTGQTLRIPETAQEPSQPAQTEAPGPTPAPTPAGTPAPGSEQPAAGYTVQAGDSLVRIARKLEISWKDLAAANLLVYPYFIHPGQELRLPDAALPAATPQQVTPAATAQPVPNATATNPDTYVVGRGEFLTGIAEAFGLDWLELARLNGLQPPYRLYPGQVLKLR